MPDAVTVILPVEAASERLTACVQSWCAMFEKLDRSAELLLVTADAAIAFPDTPTVRVVLSEQPLGYGAALRLALAQSTHPIVVFTKLDYPYTPGDLPKLLARIGESVDVYDTPRTLEAVNGVRNGVPVPMVWRMVGSAYRLFCRVVLNLPFEPLTGWLGLREHLRSWWLWLIMGVPLVDPNSGFKIVRRSVLDRFPIQSDGEFALVEIFAKMTFLTVLVAEEPLTASNERVRSPSWERDHARVLQDAQFHAPATASA